MPDPTVQMTNVRKSELVISKILFLLMDRGIMEWHLQFEDLELSDDDGGFFFPCIDWLVSENVIRIREVRRYLGGPTNGLIVDPSLTSYGFAVLGEASPVGDGGDQLSDTVKEISSGYGNYTKAGNFTGGVLASFIKSFG